MTRLAILEAAVKAARDEFEHRAQLGRSDEAAALHERVTFNEHLADEMNRALSEKGTFLTGNEPQAPPGGFEPLDVIRARLEAENAELKQDVITFARPWAAQWAKGFGLPEGHLHPTHYDVLEKCGARMDGFTRADFWVA